MNTKKRIGAGSLMLALATVGAAQAQTIHVDLAQEVVPFGATTIGFDGKVLVASPIGVLDADGIMCDALAVTSGLGAVSWGLELAETGLDFLPEGASINPVVFGVRDGWWTTSPASVRLENGRLRFAATVYFDTLVAVDIVDRNGTVVYSVENMPPGEIPITVLPVRQQLEFDFGFFAIDPAGSNTCSWEFDFSDTDAESLTFVSTLDGTPVADGIKLVAREMQPGALNVVTSVVVTGEGIPSLRLGGMTMDEAPPRCRADFNNDGTANSQDLFDFLTVFFIAEPAADINRDGMVNSQDFFDFLTAFFEGC